MFASKVMCSYANKLLTVYAFFIFSRDVFRTFLLRAASFG